MFLAYSRTSVVMASGRELCYVLLLGDFAKTVSLGRGRFFLKPEFTFRNSALLLGSLHPPGQAFSGQLCCAKVRKSNMVRTMPCGLTLDYEQCYCTYISLGAVLASPSVYATQQS